MNHNKCLAVCLYTRIPLQKGPMIESGAARERLRDAAHFRHKPRISNHFAYVTSSCLIDSYLPIYLSFRCVTKSDIPDRWSIARYD